MFPVKYVHLFYIFDIVISVSSAVKNMQRHRSKQRLCLASFLHYLHLAAAPSSPSLCQASLPLLHGAGDMFQAPRVTTFFSSDLAWQSSVHIISLRQGRLGTFGSHVAHKKRSFDIRLSGG